MTFFVVSMEQKLRSLYLTWCIAFDALSSRGEMPTKNLRLNIVLEPQVYNLIKKLAAIDGLSMALKAHELLIEALELYEDYRLSQLVHEREESLDKEKPIPHSKA
ncbi:MAG TPA: hypothetical protein VJB34_09835 [Bdellovibrionota bacterium]|nr:hypothetical protein [Bdellovibrionota bacterium]